jgi:hypothetical protein
MKLRSIAAEAPLRGHFWHRGVTSPALSLPAAPFFLPGRRSHFGRARLGGKGDIHRARNEEVDA